MSSNEWTLPEPTAWRFRYSETAGLWNYSPYEPHDMGFPYAGKGPLFTAEQMREAYAAGQRAAVPEGSDIGQLRAHNAELREKVKDMYREQYALGESIDFAKAERNRAESQRDMLAEAVRQYELEMLNPGPDYVMRHQRRKEMFEARARVSQPPAKAPTDAAQDKGNVNEQ